MELLFEQPGLARFGLPAALASAYGGDLGFTSPRLVANFVASVDGVVALGGDGESGHVVSGDSAADRFVMGLLRACADAVLIGAGTFRKSPGARWHPGAIFPDAAADFAALRARRGLRPKPPLVLVTGSGAIDPTQLALDDAIVFTSAAGAERLRPRLPAGARLRLVEGGPIRLATVIRALHDEGLSLLLTEGGPSLAAQLYAEDLLDELFLTRAPSLFGRTPGDGRKPLIDGADLAAGQAGGAQLELASLRRESSHLFLRYLVRRAH